MKNILNHDVAHQKYFEEMTRIPHGSTHEEAYSDYLVAFAKEHGLAYKQTTIHNVILYKEATLGYEDHPSVMLQAHTDMVCEKNNDVAFDFDKDALNLVLQDGFLSTQGTTLGADDGVGVAYMLALLDAQDVLHPALECVFTVQEEIGLYGALDFKEGDIQSSRMINLDHGEETSTCTSSAGGRNVIFQKPNVLVPRVEPAYILEVKGLFGGHSGGEIDKERGNANILLTRILYELNTNYGIQLSDFNGGIKDNAIPREASAVFVSATEFKKLEAYVKHMQTIIFKEYEFSDPHVCISIQKTTCKEVMSIEDSEDLLKLLLTLPNGIAHHSMIIDGLTTASSNVAVVSCKEQVEVTCSLRGAIPSYIDTLAMQMDCLGECFGFESKHEASYPAWSYDDKSELREIMMRVCQELYGHDLELEAVHGGLECGIFKAIVPDMDIVTMGPKMKDIHTPKETLDMESFDRTFVFLKTLLEKL